MTNRTFKKIFFLCIAALLGWAEQTLAEDALGLGLFKKPAATLTGRELSKTRYGNTIKVYAIPAPSHTSSTAPVRFLVNGGLHGNELLGSEFVVWLTKRFAAGESPLNNLNGGNVEIDFVPYSNPDGTLFYTRANGNHINLNRNFGVLWGVTKENPGTSAFSEVESKTLRDLIASRNYTGAVDVHGYINWVVAPTDPSDNIKGLPEADKQKLALYKKWLATLRSEAKRKLPGYEVKTAGGLGDGGAFEDYTWWQANVPAFCLEVFQENRFAVAQLANKFVELVTPKFLAGDQKAAASADTFLAYERFIFSMFDEAIQLKTKPVGDAGHEVASRR